MCFSAFRRCAASREPDAPGSVARPLFPNRPPDLEWKVVYVGSSAGPQYDQELDSVLVGPVPIGTSRFVLQTNPPDPSKIPADDIIGATVRVGEGTLFLRP